jgi:hypothetical protein
MSHRPKSFHGPQDDMSFEDYMRALTAATSTPGLSWQQIACIQAGLPFNTTSAAKAAIAAANDGSAPAPAGRAPIPTPEQLAEAQAGALL